nr:calcium/sodium antiporter [Asticcacaulis machinosus]
MNTGANWVIAQLDYVWVMAGLAFLFIGGEGLVRGATALARRLKLSNLIIGLTVVGFGTSMPELMVSLQAALKDTPDIVVGNVVGSNIANILLIMGVGALIYPMDSKSASIQRDVAVMIVATIGLLVLAYRGGIDRLDAQIMLGCLITYLVVVYVLERGNPEQEPSTQDNPAELGIFMAMAWVSLGLLALVVGADSLVKGATNIARSFGVSEGVIGLTLVAVGTSLPELTVTMIAAFKRQSDMALGNLIGSCIFNILAILGLTALVAPIAIDARFTQVDIPIALGVAVLAGLCIYIFGKIGRLIALGFLAAYASYMAFLFMI